MAKSRRVGHAAPSRGTVPSRQRAPEDLPAGDELPRRGAQRAAVGTPRERVMQAMEHPRDDGLDEWLAPDEGDDADLDQWLHDHGVDGGANGPNR